ncbi:MAG: hypothetical protein KAW12_14100 [Candidatus Aminicenantes bacterium]|nr:hypothetical protein [Candidatus Aminicenantes bacterium]
MNEERDCGEKPNMDAAPAVKDSFSGIDNPYYLYDSEWGEQFYHEDVIQRIKSVFNNQPERRVVVLQGNPGSGKTGTLKKIEREPGLLGENYVPIYLNLKKYADLDVDDLLFSLYKDVVRNLNKRGYSIPQPNYFGERRKKDNINTLESIFLTIASNLAEGKIAVVIFDELDDLLDKTEPETISLFIRYLKNIEHSWSNYGLIMAGDKRLPDFTGDKTVKTLLASSPSIDVNKMLTEANVKKLIIEPVKGKLVYAEDALKSIIYHSGGNLFFQQLICFHLINLLKKEQRNRCTKTDVEQVVKGILETPTAEFGYYWENKFTKEARIIASALADDRVTERKGSFYALRKGTLLDNIFDNRLYEEIEKLEAFGYLDSMEEGQFPHYPFKITIFGEWIKKEHPFIKTLMENIDHIADKIDLVNIIEEIEKLPAKELLPFDKEKILDISRKWYLLLKNIVTNCFIEAVSQLEEFFNTFCSTLNLRIKKGSLYRENYFIIDIENLRIGKLEEALCFVQDRPELKKNDVSYIEKQAVRFAQDAQNRLTFFFYFKRVERIENLTKKPHLSLITIEENDLKKIILSDRPREAARKVIFNKLSLERVSPYTIAGPTTTVFYGRSKIINRISSNSNTSYAIVGARKIGKSSLQLKITEDAMPGVNYLYMDLEYEFFKAKSYRLFLASLKSKIEKKFNKKVDFNKFPLGPDISKIPAVVDDLSQGGQKIIFVFDEIDHLIEFDRKNNFKLLRIFRKLSQEKICQFIFAGFEELFQKKRDLKNPLYNFCEEIVLGPLEREAALELITSPMESIGVQYKNLEDRELILGYTGCHPNLLQFFCKKLIENLDEHRKEDDRRTIFKQDIDKLYDTEYEKYIMDEVYMFSTLDRIQKLILILLVEDRPKAKDGKTFSINKISKKLLNEGVDIQADEIKKHLENLGQRFILVDKGGGNYSFALDVFPDILKRKAGGSYREKLDWR